MSKVAIFLNPAAHRTVDRGEDFLIEETDELRQRFPKERTLVPVRQLDGLVDKGAGGALAKLEDAHVVLLARRD